MMKQGRESSAEVARRLDSWVNTLSGVGTARDKTTYMQPGVVSVLSPMDLENLYATDDIAVRIVRADEIHLMAAHAHEAHPDIGLDVFHDVANVERSIGIGQGGGDKQSSGHELGWTAESMNQAEYFS